MSERFAILEACQFLAQMSDPVSLAALIAYLHHADWRVRYAAAVALGDRRAAPAAAPLIALLKEEDAAPLYTQPGDLASAPAGAHHAPVVQYPAGVSADTLAAWVRRGRLKQAAITALGQLGDPARPALPILQRYAADPKEDYAVRAAANKALGLLADRSSLPALQRAIHDEEFCTRTEAQKALAKVSAA